MSTPSTRQACAEIQLTVCYSFLHGLKWSRGDINVQLKGPEACAKMQKRAAKVGLDRPSRIVVSELESAIIATQSSITS